MDAGKAKIKLIEVDKSSLWDGFVSSSANNTFYQKSSYIDYYKFKADSVRKILFTKKNKAIASICAGLKRSRNLTEFLSPFSASFSGFCQSDGLGLGEAMEIVDSLSDYLKKEGVSTAVIRQTPHIYNRSFDENIDFALLRGGYCLSREELTLYMHSLDSVSPKVRQNIRKAERSGLKFAQREDVEEAYDFILFQKKNKSMEVSVPFDELVKLKGLFPESIKTFTVNLDNKIIAAIVIYILNDTCALGFNWGQDERSQGHRPTDFMIYKSAQWLFSKGFKFFDLGTVTINGKPNFGLSRFKESFGTRGAIRRTFVKEVK